MNHPIRLFAKGSHWNGAGLVSISTRRFHGVTLVTITAAANLLEYLTPLCTNNGWISELSNDEKAVIQKYQPYEGGPDGEMLGILNDMSNKDKHRLVIGVGTSGAYVDSAIPALAKIAAAAHNRRGFPVEVLRPAKLGTELYRAIVPGLSVESVDMAGHLVPVPIFTDSGIPPRLAIATTNQMIESVEKLLLEFVDAPTDKSGPNDKCR